MRAAVAMVGAALIAACGSTPDVSGNQSAGGTQPATAGQTVMLKTSDGAVVHGRFYAAREPKALILLFHQAGSSKGEYATIAPRLVDNGYSALAIDQRSGGDLFGHNENATAGEGDPGYLSARADLQGAIDWAKLRKLPVIVWGSSYSSSLVFPLAVANAGTVKAVLAFSPGEYFNDKLLVERAAAKLTVPAYITSASKPDEIVAASAIAHAVPHGLATQYVPKTGVHGSSTLIADKDPQGADTNWMPVLAFLRKVAP